MSEFWVGVCLALRNILHKRSWVIPILIWIIDFKCWGTYTIPSNNIVDRSYMFFFVCFLLTTSNQRGPLKDLLEIMLLENYKFKWSKEKNCMVRIITWSKEPSFWICTMWSVQICEKWLQKVLFRCRKFCTMFRSNAIFGSIISSRL